MNSKIPDHSVSFQDKVVLVTGGGTGIGRATALCFAQQGAAIVVNYSRSRAEAQATVEEIRQLGSNAIAICADMVDEQQIRAMFDQVAREFGRLDMLVNNAATTKMVPYTDLDAMTLDCWDHVFAVNVRGTFLCTRAAISLLRQSGQGQIVNVTSVAGFTGMGSSIAYSASKAAINNMTKAFAQSQAPAIRVNAVAPGVVDTRWIQGWEHFTEPHRKATPLQRLAQPTDIATAIYGLAINPFITGQILVVDGGRLGTI